MQFFFFKQKRDLVLDGRLVNRTPRDFKVQAETKEDAIRMHSKGSAVTTKKSPPGKDVILKKLTELDIVALYDISDYNFAIHREVEELYGESHE